MTALPIPVQVKPLPPRQQKILDAIRRYWAEHHYAPSIRDLQVMTGLRSTSAVSYNLSRLEGKGLIKLPPMGSFHTRAIVPVGGPCPCCGRSD